MKKFFFDNRNEPLRRSLSRLSGFGLAQLFIFFSFLSLFFSCDDSTNPPEADSINLKLEDVSCTEAWITLTTNNLQLPAEINLLRTDVNGYKVSQISLLTTEDSLLYIDSLLPNQTYKFQSVIQSINQSSNELNITTMDTTSHNFTFETYTFGKHSNSVLYDVAIINENNIWAVGEIYMNDSLGNPDPIFYNLAVWDGQKWDLRKVYYKYINYANQQDSIIAHLRAIFAFNENDIWLGIGNIIRWDGKRFISIDIPNNAFNSTMNKIWGTSSNDLYVVGISGSIAHYQNGRWQRIESGTDVDINDVFGVKDSRNNQLKIFCSVSNVLEISDHKIITIDENNNVDSLHWNIDRRINSVWSDNGWIVYTSGGGVFNNKSGIWKEETSIPLYYTNRIRGNALNDIFVGGDFGLLAHFNGVRWKVYDEFLQLPVASFNIAVKDNKVVAVGYTGEKAIIIIGRRN
ncbi:MAG: hypothetical protein STSR0008_24820 [Ignavibacterium sp.]